MDDKEKTLEIVKPIISLAADAIEYGIEKTFEHFKDKEIDPYLGPQLVRYHAKEYFMENSWRIDNFYLEKIPSNGLSLYYKNFHIRLWKDTGSELPSPGTSVKKNGFLRQQQKNQITLLELLGEKPCDNLALFWEVDEKYYLKGMRLSMPAYDPTGTAKIKALWSESIDHPVIVKEHMLTRHHEPVVEDLPYELLDDEKVVKDESGD